MLVFEEVTQDSEPIKFYGYKDKFMSANEQTKMPNYALMIFDVSLDIIHYFHSHANKVFVLFLSSTM